MVIDFVVSTHFPFKNNKLIQELMFWGLAVKPIFLLKKLFGKKLNDNIKK